MQMKSKFLSNRLKKIVTENGSLECSEGLRSAFRLENPREI